MCDCFTATNSDNFSSTRRNIESWNNELFVVIKSKVEQCDIFCVAYFIFNCSARIKHTAAVVERNKYQ